MSRLQLFAGSCRPRWRKDAQRCVAAMHSAALSVQPAPHLHRAFAPKACKPQAATDNGRFLPNSALIAGRAGRSAPHRL